jgi:hypothetical protein
LSKETIDEYIKESGGTEHATARREYFCEDVIDSRLAVIPEFDDAKEEALVAEYKRPHTFKVYGAMDPAFNDFTAYLLGYYDFVTANYVVEGELLFNQASTPEIAENIVNLEKEIFPNDKVYVRYSDTSPQVICDLGRIHNLFFSPTRKDNKEAQVNYVRTIISENRLYINPRCKNLIRQLKTAIWNDQRTKFQRTETEGHFDLIDALIYLLRNIDIYTNPYGEQNINANNKFVNFQPQHKVWAESLLGV